MFLMILAWPSHGYLTIAIQVPFCPSIFKRHPYPPSLPAKSVCHAFCFATTTSKWERHRTVLLNLSRRACSSSLRSCSRLALWAHCSLAWETPFCIGAEEVVPAFVDFPSSLSVSCKTLETDAAYKAKCTAFAKIPHAVVAIDGALLID